jgi:hypothetical protein
MRGLNIENIKSHALFLGYRQKNRLTNTVERKFRATGDREIYDNNNEISKEQMFFLQQGK